MISFYLNILLLGTIRYHIALYFTLKAKDIRGELILTAERRE